jgi:hypothetical protein
MGYPGFAGYVPAAVPYAAAAAPAATGEQQLDALKQQAEYFEGALEDIRKRIEQLQAQSSEKGK